MRSRMTRYSDRSKRSSRRHRSLRTARRAMAPGTFQLTRSGGDTSAPIDVSLVYSGSATNGVDYATLSSPIALGTSRAVTVTPLADSLLEDTETVTATITGAGTTYTIGTSGSATVSIGDMTPNARVIGPGDGEIPPAYSTIDWEGEAFDGITPAAPADLAWRFVDATGAPIGAPTGITVATQIDGQLTRFTLTVGAGATRPSTVRVQLYNVNDGTRSPATAPIVTIKID